MFIFIIISYILVMFFEITPLLKEKNNGKIIFYFSLLTFAMIISFLLSLGVQLPSPSNGIKDFVEAIFGKTN